MRFALFLVPTLTFAAQPKAVTSFLDQHCFECHDADVKKGGLDLTSLKFDLKDPQLFEKWVKVHDSVADGEMPPKKKPRPEAKLADTFLEALDSQLRDTSAAQTAAQGRTLVRRLNRIEYENTVRDLLHIDTPLAGLLPEDTPMHGFDTVAEGLRFSQLQIEKYLEAADAALDAAVDLRMPVELKKERFSYKDEKWIIENLALPDHPPEDPKKKYSRKRVVFRDLPDALVLFTDADYMLGLSKFKLRRSGTYRIRLSAYGYQSTGEPVTARIYANDYSIGKRLLGHWDIPADKPGVVEVVTRINRSEHLMLLPFRVGYDAEGKRLNDSDTTKEFKGRGLAVQWIEIEGPLEMQDWPPRSVKSLFPGVPVVKLDEKKINNRHDTEKAIGFELQPADPAASLKLCVETFAAKAFRRPLESGETDRFVKLAQDSLASGASFLDAAKFGLRAVLTSPQFLLFDELPGPRLSDHALASRLSYFLWSTLPDDELMRLADAKKLHEPETLKKQLARLLADKRSQAFVKNFSGQWLDLRSIDATSPDSMLYPEFDEMLKYAMVGETEAFFAELLHKDLPVTNFIQSDFLMLNRRIAEHYGIGLDVAKSERFVRVSLPADSVRGGVLTQASILKVTANGTVSSPVLRGGWVMKRLLGQPPPPPPPGIPGVEPDTRGASTIREILAKHSNAENCAGCHAKIDPPGFALESFDVIGGWRDRYRSKEKGDRPSAKVENRGVWQYKVSLPVDASGQLADGRAFKDIKEFKQLLLAQPADVQRCLTEKLLTYATGAAPTYADSQAVNDIVTQSLKQGGGLKTFVTELVLSDTFRRK
jgi:mono/diheme cytochrome c family protein